MPIPFEPRAVARRTALRCEQRLLGSKLQEIADRAPDKIAAFEVLADYTIDELNAHDQRRPTG